MATLKQAIQNKKNTGVIDPKDWRNFVIGIAEDVVARHISEMENEIRSKIGQMVENQIDDVLIKTLKPKFKGDKGDTIIGPQGPIGPRGPIPVAGIDFELPTKGVDYFTPQEREQFLNELIKHIPPPKDGSSDTPQQIASKLNTLTSAINPEVIIGLTETFKILRQALRENRKQVKQIGGGMGNVVHETKPLTSTTTQFTTTYKVAAKGFAMWAYYQGQWLVKDTAFTVGSDFKTFSLLFTPVDGAYIDIAYVRT